MCRTYGMTYLYSAFEKVQSPLNQHLEEVSLKCSHCNLIGQSTHRITSVPRMEGVLQSAYYCKCLHYLCQLSNSFVKLWSSQLCLFYFHLISYLYCNAICASFDVSFCPSRLCTDYGYRKLQTESVSFCGGFRLIWMCLPWMVLDL